MLGLVVEDDDSSGLRWVLAAIGACQDMPRAKVLRLIGPPGQATVNRAGRESWLIGQAGGALVLIEAFDQAAMVGAALREEGRGRGSLLAMISGVGYAAAIASRRGGRLRTAEERLRAAVDLASRNRLMALTTVLHLCVDALVERYRPGAACRGWLRRSACRRALRPDGQRRDAARSARRAAAERGDRAGAEAELRAAGSCRSRRASAALGSWRSRLALALARDERDAALSLAGEEMRLAEALDPPPPRPSASPSRHRDARERGDRAVARVRLRAGQARASLSSAPSR